MKYSKYRKEIIFISDLFIVLLVSCILFLIMAGSENAINDLSKAYILYPHLILLIISWAVTQWLFKTYESLWRYAQSREYLAMTAGSLVGYIIFLLLDCLIFKNQRFMLYFLSVYSISLLGMLLMRICYRQYRIFKKCTGNKKKIPVAIIGAGEAGVKLSEELESNPVSKFHTICFIDDSNEKIGKRIHNIEVRGPIANINKILEELPIQGIIIAIPSLPAKKRKMILHIGSLYHYRIWIMPDTLTIMQGGYKGDIYNSVRNINLEDLLGREQVTFNHCRIDIFLQNKVVLVTGAGGSIGCELCRQIAKIKPEKLILVDIYENNVYDIQQELLRDYGNKLEMKVEIASIRDKRRINSIFEKYRPAVIFHAAAHKHVPLMEECPEEAIANNIYGTNNVIWAADRYGAEKFVLISTDKAVNPTSVMGASKRFCEMLLRSMKGVSKTDYIAVRFGNVLGSNGSVIPLFTKQIRQGGPVTITDMRIVRFFMTISEAVQLVLQAGAMSQKSAVYILDMGEPVKIIELAENLILLSGHVPYSEIPIIETGLRPGEKLYEELFMNKEELAATDNHKIYIVHQDDVTRKEMKEKMNMLSQAMRSRSAEDLKEAMKQVIPSYRNQDEVNKDI